MIISPSAISPYKIPTFQSGGAPFVGLLDLYPSAAAAYSVRLLKSDYAGSAIEVRRSSDNALQDIGFNANGDLDTTSLLSFVGAGDGFVSTWYDQSGNAVDLQQTTTSLQPQLISSGALLVDENNKTILQFTSQYLTAFVSFSQPLNIFFVRKYRANGVYVALGINTIGSEAYGDINNGGTFRSFYGVYLIQGTQNTDNGLWYSLANGLNSEVGLKWRRCC